MPARGVACARTASAVRVDAVKRLQLRASSSVEVQSRGWCKASAAAGVERHMNLCVGLLARGCYKGNPSIHAELLEVQCHVQVTSRGRKGFGSTLQLWARAC